MPSVYKWKTFPCIFIVSPSHPTTTRNVTIRVLDKTLKTKILDIQGHDIQGPTQADKSFSF